jgi:DNA-binding MarR family transcriptional regulator
MARRQLPVIEDDGEPLARRIAVGLHKVGLALKQQTWQQANQDGLSATQGQLLAILVASGPLTGTELGERLGVTLPTISDSVRVLVDKGLVTRAPDPRHPRASLLSPTTRGRALGARARAWPEFLADAVATLSETEQAAFYRGIVKMIRSLQEQGLVPLSGMCVTCTHFRPHAHDGPSPHHCAFVDAPIADVQLRLDCPDHALAADAARAEQWAQYLRPG